MRGHSPNFHIHVSASDLYIPTIDLPTLPQEICGPILGIYQSLTGTMEIPRKGTQMGFSLQCISNALIFTAS
jgi:hypothetical protein